VADQTQAGDFVILLGAGDITKWAYELPAQLEALNASARKQRA
jgi:UDP-N-acetylmuramate--alanine ligase